MRKWRVAILGLGHWYSAYNLARALPEYPRRGTDRGRRGTTRRSWTNSPARSTSTATPTTTRSSSTSASTSSTSRRRCRELEDLTIKAARAGKHMILGKPMAMTVEQADRMVEAVETAGVTCFPFQGIDASA